MRFTLRGSEVEEILLIRFDIYSPQKNPTYLGPEIELHMEVEGDGLARLAYEDEREEDEYGRPRSVAVPARVGREGDTFGFRVSRTDVAEAARGRRVPEWSGFLWGGITFYRTTIEGERRSISDDVHAYLAMGVVHEATAGPDGCVVMDAFAPPRDDWERFEPQDPRPPRWP